MFLKEVNNVSYRIYANINGWKLINVFKKTFDVVCALQELIKNSKTCLVVFYDFDLDADYEWYRITDQETLKAFSDDLLNVPRGIEKVYTKQKQ